MSEPTHQGVSQRTTSLEELDEVIGYWLTCPRHSGYYVEQSLIRFLRVFTPEQIKGAMYLATCHGRGAYFRYFCGIMHNWKRMLEVGEEPPYFDVNDKSKKIEQAEEE